MRIASVCLVFETPRWRRGAALYGVIFLLAVALAPHRHSNSLEDLLSDGPSDSGIFVASPVGAAEGVPSLSSSRLIDDDPCLACFHHDYAASAGSSFHFPEASCCLLQASFVSPERSSFPLGSSVAQESIPAPPSEPSASRSPPGSTRLS